MIYCARLIFLTFDKEVILHLNDAAYCRASRMSYSIDGRAAQQAIPADAAVRPQDRRHFEIWTWPECIPDQELRRS